MKTVNLDKVIADHQLWVESGYKQGKRANLRVANLAYADLEGAYLQEADLGWADLQEADLCKANLQEADLQGADLQGADLSGANLQEARLFRADLFRADLQGVIVPPSIRHCLSFGYAKFSRDALPWLILHPRWADDKDTVQIIDN